jgi:hypothetical protein
MIRQRRKVLGAVGEKENVSKKKLWCNWLYWIEISHIVAVSWLAYLDTLRLTNGSNVLSPYWRCKKRWSHTAGWSLISKHFQNTWIILCPLQCAILSIIREWHHGHSPTNPQKYPITTNDYVWTQHSLIQWSTLCTASKLFYGGFHTLLLSEWFHRRSEKELRPEICVQLPSG